MKIFNEDEYIAEQWRIGQLNDNIPIYLEYDGFGIYYVYFDIGYMWGNLEHGRHYMDHDGIFLHGDIGRNTRFFTDEEAETALQKIRT